MRTHMIPARRHVIAACVMVLIVAQDTASAGSPGHAAEPADPVRVRKNVTALTAQERQEYVGAVLALKSAPSPFDPQLSYYDQFVAWHLSLYPCALAHDMTRAHGGPMFLPWHRLFLLLFEDALRQVSGKPITVPYWDWTDPAGARAVFADDFMGGDGDPDDGFAVNSGPFRKGEWDLRVHPIGLEWSASATPHLTRRFASFPGFETLPTPGDVTWLLDRPRYDVAPYDPASDPNRSFRNALEGFWQRLGQTSIPTGSMTCGPDGVMTVTSGPGLHNLVHAWVGGLLETTPEGPKLGTMFLPTSPNDPVFFLHHANIDRLWSGWQETHGIDSYEPSNCDLLEPVCRSNSETDPMHPFEATPADVADIDALGYRYDTAAGAGRVLLGRTRPTVAENGPLRCEVGRSSGMSPLGISRDPRSVAA